MKSISHHALFKHFVICFLVSSVVPAWANDAPFVAGWDRFGRYDEIDTELSSALLISELGCVACHSSGNPIYQPKAGPGLDDAGTRLKRKWVSDYLMNPSGHRHGTTMPDVLASYPQEQKLQAVEALTAFLMSQRKPLSEIKGNGINPVPLEFWKYGNVERGQELYHRSGCVACHAADEGFEVGEMKLSDADRRLDQLDPEDIADLGLEAAARRINSVPHPKLHRKYTVKSLTWFLMNPAAVRPSGRMPNLGIRAVDAADLAAWLVQRSDSETAGGTVEEELQSQVTERELVRKGSMLFQQSGCVNCHSSPRTSTLRRRSLQSVAATWNLNGRRSSCVSGPTGRMPNYGLNEAQSQQLSRALKDVNTGLNAGQSIQLTMLQLNCYACHQRDEIGGVGRYRKVYFETVGQIDIGDEGRLPPPLTKVGARLQSKWLKDVFKGKAALRSFMTIRMPEYPDATVRSLPSKFLAVDHPEVFPSEQQVFGNLTGLEEAGRQLMDAGCVQCHVFNGESLPGTVGVDLSGVTERVHRDWLKAFLLDPGSIKKGTRMPTFFPGGKSQNATILNGDTSKQVSAIYAYLKKMDGLPLPQKIDDVRNQDFELRPVDQPIVFRTFMPVAGTHAIAIGYPNQVHVAFDAENLFFAEAWRGRFLDAQGTWYVRSAPPAVPLGQGRITLPSGPTFARLSQATEMWPTKVNSKIGRFDGYSLDKSGVPILKYHLGSTAFTDRVDPADDGAVVRTLTVIASAETEKSQAGDQVQNQTLRPMWMKAHEGKRLEQVAAGEFVNENGLQVKVQGVDLSKGQLVRKGLLTSWLLPVSSEAQPQITIQYRW